MDQMGMNTNIFCRTMTGILGGECMYQEVTSPHPRKIIGIYCTLRIKWASAPTSPQKAVTLLLCTGDGPLQSSCMSA